MIIFILSCPLSYAPSTTHTDNKALVNLAPNSWSGSAGNCGDQKLTGQSQRQPSCLYQQKQPDLLFITKRRLGISSEVGGKQVAIFQSEANGELVIELMSYSYCDSSGARSPNIMGTTSISLQDLQNPVNKQSMERWFELEPASGIVGSKPISLHIAVSVTAPVPAPYVLYMVQGKPSSRNTSLFPLPERVPQANNWTNIVDVVGNEVISIQMRYIKLGPHNFELVVGRGVGYAFAITLWVVAQYSHSHRE